MPRKCYGKSINFDSSYKVGTLLRDRIQMLVVTIFIFSSFFNCPFSIFFQQSEIFAFGLLSWQYEEDCSFSIKN